MHIESKEPFSFKSLIRLFFFFTSHPLLKNLIIARIKEIYKSFKEIGYQITHKELLAADFGTPQKRRRLFFVAAKDLHLFEFPQPTHCEFPNLLGLPTYEGVGSVFPVKNY